MHWTSWLVTWSNDLVTTHSAFKCSKAYLPGYMTRCSNEISSPSFVLWRIFARTPGRLRKSAFVRETPSRVPPPQVILLDPPQIETQHRGIIIFLVMFLLPHQEIIHFI